MTRRPKISRSGRIVEATRSLAEAIYDAWNNDDVDAIQLAYNQLNRVHRRTTEDGEEVPEWPGNVLTQGDVTGHVMDLLKCFGVDGPND
jgi:hypothetical protein